VLLHGGRIGFIDFDGFGRAEPGLDLGLFLATTANVAVRAAPADQRAAALATMDDLISRFLRRYQDEAPVSVDRVALWQALALLTAVLHCWTKIRPDRLAPNLLLLEHHVRSAGLT
jgi:aminoglycoside phosphotransferase (APT) family kinase protein